MDIKLWEPISDTPCDLTDLDSIILRNETMLQESRNTITVPSSFILHVLAYLNRRRRSKSCVLCVCVAHFRVHVKEIVLLLYNGKKILRG